MLDQLETMAREVAWQPWGIGHDFLVARSESWAPYLRFLHAYVSRFRPEAVLETGVYMATASAHMALASPNTMVIGIDREYHPAAVEVPLHFPNVHLLEGDTTDPEMPRRVKELLAGRKIGLLFLDSTHDGETPKLEFSLYAPLLGSPALICCDDLLGPQHLKEKMQTFWEWLPGPKRELHFLHPKVAENHDEPGFGIAYYSGELPK